MIKLRQNHNKKAQSTIEWTMVVVILAAALLCMQHFIKRAAEGRLRAAADTIGEQYDAYNVDSGIITIKKGNTIINSTMTRVADEEAEEGSIDGLETTIRTMSETNSRGGYEELGKFSGKLFN